ncbi:glycosyltransferase [Desulfosporosinus sp. FKA]|uniref:glycosyltransferase n=1 Tax=Desulfosporosinus sp. FKA TaxID=1969834 RepID=UPI00155518B0|nr:glycosyltransferase [Desulfosporosinus sp. FKA]
MIVKNVAGKSFALLKQEISSRNGSEFIIYGAGTNGEVFCGYLQSLGIDIAFFVDKQADIREFEVLGKTVLSPKGLFNNYNDEIVIISPDNNKDIHTWLIENCIPERNIILPFEILNWNIIELESESYEGPFYQKVPIIDKNATFFTIVYNTPSDLLRRAIESVLRQTDRNFEYLIIDNGSTDGSAEIIEQYSSLDCRIKVVTFKENLLWTESFLIQTLADNICGKYVCQLDSDDYYEPTFLEKTLKAANENDADFVQVGTLTYPEDNFKYSSYTQTFGSNRLILGSEIQTYLALRIINVTVWGKLYSTEIFRKLIDNMLEFGDEERKSRFLLDISWVSVLADNSSRVCLIDEILHIRTWRKGSGEFSSANIANWLGAICYAIDVLGSKINDEVDLRIFADSALMWLFGLSRRNLSLTDYDENCLKRPYVNEMLKRPSFEHLSM